MMSLFGIFGPKMSQVVKSKHMAQEIPFQQIFQLRPHLSVLYGFGSGGYWTWQHMHDLPLWPGWLSSRWCASAVAVVDWALYCGYTLERARDSCHKPEIYSNLSLTCHVDSKDFGVFSPRMKKDWLPGSL